MFPKPKNIGTYLNILTNMKEYIAEIWKKYKTCWENMWENIAEHMRQHWEIYRNI